MYRFKEKDLEYAEPKPYLNIYSSQTVTWELDWGDVFQHKLIKNLLIPLLYDSILPINNLNKELAMSTQSRFYGVNIDTPLSLAHNTSQWDNSTIGKLNRFTKDCIFICEIPIASRNAEYGWRVVDAYFSQEDSVITYFHAYDLDGAFMAGASYGVHYDNQPHRISGGFKYAPEFGNQYYVPVENNFATPNTGGYTAQVLDLEYPSEGLGFGLYKQGEKHSALVIKFRLFRLGANYPNDLDLPIR